MRNSIKLALIFFIISLIGSLIYLNYSNFSFEQEEKEPIKIIMNVWPGFGHLFIALEEKYFKKEGVFVEINLVQDYSDMIKGFKSGAYDGFLGVYSDAILFFAEGTPIKVVYVSAFSEGANVLIGKPEIENMQDLKGKTIGVIGFNSFSHLFVLKLLENAGLKESDVKIVEVPDGDVLRLLELNKIDAGHAWEPLQSEALVKGYTLLATSKETPGMITDILALKEDIVNERPDDVQKVIDGLFKALEFMNKNPKKSSSVVFRRTGVSPEELKEGIAGTNMFDKEENILAFTKSEDPTSLYYSGEFISNFFVESGVIDSTIDIDDLLAPQFVMHEDNFVRKMVIVLVVVAMLTLIGFLIGRYFDEK